MLRAFLIALLVSTFASSGQAQTLTPEKQKEYYAAIKEEEQNWRMTREQYRQDCLTDLDSSQIVPRDRSMDMMNCYQLKIHQLVLPTAVAKEDLRILIDEWFDAAQAYEHGEIDIDMEEKRYIESWHAYEKKRNNRLKSLIGGR